ncbi:MAG: hypothetical protein WCV62_04310 [Candidatus Peribacteraceae bacterium]|jgi:hypothetical protein
MSRIPHDLPRRDGGEDQPASPSFIDILERLLRAHDDSSDDIPDTASETSFEPRMERFPGRPFIRFQDKPMDDAHSRDIQSEQGLFLEYRTDAWVVSGTCFISLRRESAEGY